MFKKQQPMTSDEYYSKNMDSGIYYEEYLEQFNEEQYLAEQQFYSWWDSLDDEEKYHYQNTRPEAIAKRLKELRKKFGATQEQVAKLIGVTKQTVSNYEKGQSTPPSKVLDKLSILYSVPLHYILGTEQSQESAINNEIVANVEYIKSLNHNSYIYEMNTYYDEDYPTEKEWIIPKINNFLDMLEADDLYDIFQYAGFKTIMTIEKEGLDYAALIESENNKTNK